jgi:hypothetical protein
MAVMLKFEIRVRIPKGSEVTLVILAPSRRDAEIMASAQTGGGKVLGGRQLPR